MHLAAIFGELLRDQIAGALLGEAKLGMAWIVGRIALNSSRASSTSGMIGMGSGRARLRGRC